jgi:hypothetical protein
MRAQRLYSQLALLRPAERHYAIRSQLPDSKNCFCTLIHAKRLTWHFTSREKKAQNMTKLFSIALNSTSCLERFGVSRRIYAKIRCQFLKTAIITLLSTQRADRDVAIVFCVAPSHVLLVANTRAVPPLLVLQPLPPVPPPHPHDPYTNLSSNYVLSKPHYFRLPARPFGCRSISVVRQHYVANHVISYVRTSLSCVFNTTSDDVIPCP